MIAPYFFAKQINDYNKQSCQEDVMYIFLLMNIGTSGLTTKALEIRILRKMGLRVNHSKFEKYCQENFKYEKHYGKVYLKENQKALLHNVEGLKGLLATDEYSSKEDYINAIVSDFNNPNVDNNFIMANMELIDSGEDHSSSFNKLCYRFMRKEEAENKLYNILADINSEYDEIYLSNIILNENVTDILFKLGIFQFKN